MMNDLLSIIIIGITVFAGLNIYIKVKCKYGEKGVKIYNIILSIIIILLIGLLLLF